MGANVYLTVDEKEMIIQAIRNFNIGILDALNDDYNGRDIVRKLKLSKENRTCESVLHKMGVKW